MWLALLDLVFLLHEVESIYSAVFVLGPLPADSLVHTCSCLDFWIRFPYRLLQESSVEFPVLYSRSFLIISSVYRTVYLLTLTS